MSITYKNKASDLIVQGCTEPGDRWYLGRDGYEGGMVTTKSCIKH